MELFKDGDLNKHLNSRGTFPETEAASITTQVAQALKYMHQQKIVHRDIKPSVGFDANQPVLENTNTV